MHKLGYKRLITTPHTNELYPNTKEQILAGHKTIEQAVNKANIPIELIVSSEYQIDFSFIERIEKDDLITFGDRNLLIELPFMNPPSGLKEVLFELQMARYRLILAHPERYSYYHNDFKFYDDLKNRGIKFQINISSLAGHYSPAAQNVAEKLIKEGMVDFIGSDAHNMNYIEKLKLALTNKHLHALMTSGKLKNKTLIK